VINPQYRHATGKPSSKLGGLNMEAKEPVKTALPKIITCPYIGMAGSPAMAINVL